MKRVAFRLVILGALVVASGASLVFLPVTAYVFALLTQIQELGPWAPVVLSAAYIPASVLIIPGSLLTLGAGFAFGLVCGTVAVSIGSTLGASAAFLVGRTLARPWIEAKVGRKPEFRAIDRAIGEQGFKIILLLRLSPAFPFNLLNYALSLTKVTFRDYVLASWIGMLPGTVVYVYLGSAGKDLAELFTGRSERGTAEKVLFFVGLVATIAVTVYVTRLAKRALEQQGVPHV
jgi:uncharacterized membrane protein YdjX (TVP38/TMEM64 family)